MGSPTIFFGNTKVKHLKKTASLNGGCERISSTTDPTSVAVDAPAGTILQNETSGSIYKKNDSGSTTNWTRMATTADVVSSVAPTVQKFTSGSGTYTRPTSPTPLYIRVTMVGGGGGGAGSANNTTADAGSGADGTDTTFGTTLLSAGKGVGALSAGAGTQQPGTGGTSSLGSGPLGLALTGSAGGATAETLTASSTVIGFKGGHGGASALGGSGRAGDFGAGTGGAGATNTGGGGGGGYAGSSITNKGWPGAGGGSGGMVQAIINSPAGTYSYVVGAGGAGGTAGTGGNTGGAGGSGVILVEEFYQ